MQRYPRYGLCDMTKALSNIKVECLSPAHDGFEAQNLIGNGQKAEKGGRNNRDGDSDFY